MKEAPERRCPRCGGERIETTHRAEGGERRDLRNGKDGVKRGEQKLCFNGKVKAEHICVAECWKSGLFCRNCRILTDASGMGGA